MAEKTKYSADELEEFKIIILEKIADSRKEYRKLQDSLRDSNEHGTIDTSNSYKTLDDGASTFEKENNNQLASRLKKFIANLEAALFRIENGTYGVCRVSGKLISKERLRAVPHTTLSMESKLNQYK